MLEEEDIRAVFAGQTERLNREALWPPMSFDYFQKQVFPAIYVNYERVKWNASSIATQPDQDHWKETLLCNWIFDQRLMTINSIEDEDKPRIKRRRQVQTWGSLMSRYQANARMVHLNVQIRDWSHINITRRWYTPNWKREDAAFKHAVMHYIPNRNVGLTNGGWSIKPYM